MNINPYISIQRKKEIMKEILFATNNKTKSQRFTKGLEKHNIKVLTPKDLELNISVDENGPDAISNALIKARAYAKKVNIPVFAMDDTLYLENVPTDKQPKTLVRRVNGKTLTDEQMIEHYTKLVKEYGQNGEITACWIYGMALINNKQESTYTWKKENFVLKSTKTNKINPGYPLNSISFNIKLNKYFTDITEEDKKLIQEDESDVINFIIDSLNKS